MENIKMKKMKLMINDLPVDAVFYDDDIENIFYPLLKKLTQLQKKKGMRLVVFLAATPGTGKSTLVKFLETLSNKKGLTKIQSIGIDGFHYPNSYLKTHHLSEDVTKPYLIDMKGAPESFDVEKLNFYLSNIQNDSIIWPIYSRINHDIDFNGEQLKEDIILLEGNYLLLNKHPWNQLICYADFTIFIKGNNEVQRKHLIQRKQAGGASAIDAERHYENTDLKNTNLIENNSIKADLTLFSNQNMKYTIDNS